MMKSIRNAQKAKAVEKAEEIHGLSSTSDIVTTYGSTAVGVVGAWLGERNADRIRDDVRKLDTFLRDLTPGDVSFTTTEHAAGATASTFTVTVAPIILLGFVAVVGTGAATDVQSGCSSTVNGGTIATFTGGTSVAGRVYNLLQTGAQALSLTGNNTLFNTTSQSNILVPVNGTFVFNPIKTTLTGAYTVMAIWMSASSRAVGVVTAVVA